MAAQFCPYCGKPVTAAGATFCAFCGRSLTGQAPPQPSQPLPSGANPPGMVAVPIVEAPGAGPLYDAPLAGAAAGPTYYQAPPSAYGTAYLPPPAYGTAPPAHAATAYTPIPSARSAFSTARAVWCAIAVVVVAIGLGVGLEFSTFMPYVIYRYGRFIVFAIAFGIPSGYWLGLSRLPYRQTWRASVEVIGINVVLLFMFIGIGFEFGHAGFSTDYYFYFPGYIGLLPTVAFGILGALIASASGLGFARIVANWTVLRAYAATEGARTQLLQTIGTIVVAILLFFVIVLLYTRIPHGFFYFFYHFGLLGDIIIVFLPFMISGTALTWFATWSTLRLLRRSVAASSVPVAPGV